MDMALAIQQVTEEILFKLAKTAVEKTGCRNLVMAGGVALNSVANGKLITQGIVDSLWVQPAAGDAGGSLGAALAAWHIYFEQKRIPNTQPDSMQGAYLGPEYSSIDIEQMIRKYNAHFDKFENNFNQLATQTAQALAAGNVVGWFQGRMEFGPRALGNRSILGDARNAEMQKKMNLKIKYREGFRPFAPSVLEEDIQEYFELSIPSPYMLLVIPVVENHRKTLPEGFNDLPLYEKLYHLRSDIPSVTHIDFSARIQSVNKNTNPRYHTLISKFKNETGYGLLVNTSFNVRGEPIVCTPDDAYRCFMRTEMDYLVINDYLFYKKNQPDWDNIERWQKEKFAAD